MFCPNCGSKLEDDSLFCGECGAAIDGPLDEGGAGDETQLVEDEIDFGGSPATEEPGEASDPFATPSTPSARFADAPVDTTFVAPDNQQAASFAATAAAPQTTATKPGGGNKAVLVVAIVAIVAVLAVAAIAFFMLRPQADTTYSIQFETDGGTAIAAQQIEEGTQVTSPSNPTKNGYEFVGWYSNPERTDQVTFPFAAEEDVVLYAKWEEADEEEPVSPSSSSTVSATVEPSSSASTSSAEGFYIIPDSSSTLLSRSDLNSLSDDDLEIAMNEIWARHGRMFKNNWLQSHFDSQPWYTGTIAADDFLSKYTPTTIEDENSKLMSEMLSERGYNVNKRHPN